jgi:hypothetical protein
VGSGDRLMCCGKVRSLAWKRWSVRGHGARRPCDAHLGMTPWPISRPSRIPAARARVSPVSCDGPSAPRPFTSSMPCIGLAVDGTTTACYAKQCHRYCRPQQDSAKQFLGYRHHVVPLSAVRSTLALPYDVEMLGPRDGACAAVLRGAARDPGFGTAVRRLDRRRQQLCEVPFLMS